MPLPHTARRRLACAGGLAAVIILGLVSRAAPIGWSVYDKSLGDVLYAVAAYVTLALLMPRLPIATVAALATAACFAVEFLQLTELNKRLLTVPVLRGFLGTTFHWHDLVCYLVGVAVAASLDVCCLPRREGPD